MTQEVSGNFRINFKPLNAIFLGILGLVFGIFLVSAAPILDQLHLNIQTTDSNGNVITGTYNFVFNISTTNDCNNVVYSNSTSLTTDSRGIISYYLENTNLDYDSQYYLCYYRDGNLIDTSPVARTPYSFTAQNTTLSGMSIDTNLNLGSYNATATYYFGSGKYLTDINVSEIDLSNYYTKSEILGFGYYNLSSFNINDYFTSSQILGFGYWNDTYATFNKTYADTLYYSITNPNNYLNETTLNLSQTNYWTLNGTDLYYAGGNVGIGTTAPNYKLEVAGDLNVSNVLFLNTTTNNLGIGTTSPGSKLSVVGGNLEVINTDTDAYLYIGESNAGGKFGQIKWTASDDTLRFGTNTGGDTITILESGNVGIGTTAPSQLFSVGSNFYVSSTGNVKVGSGGQGIGYDPVGGGVGRANIFFGSSGLMEIDGTTIYIPGNVGIGTTSPGEKLEISGSNIGDLNTILVRNTDSTNTSSGAGIGFIPTSASWGGAIYANRAGLGSLYFGTTDSAGGTPFDANKIRMVIDKTGNVGIGTTSPQTKLHVNGSAIINGTLIGLSNATDLTGAVTLAQLQAVNTSAGTETDPYWTGNWTDVAFINKANAFGAFNQSFDTNVLFVDSSTDRVGIGTTAPARALSVYKTGTNYIQVVNDVTGITTADGLNFGVNSAGLSYIWNYENSDMVFGSNNAEVMRFNSGNVGIGTTSPSTKLDVQNGGVNIYLG